MYELRSSAQALDKPLRFALAVVAVFIPRVIAAAAVRLVWLAAPVYGGWSGYGGWSSYLFGYTLCVSIVAAFGVAMLVRVFGYELSYAGALMALFAGDVASIAVYKMLVGNSARSAFLVFPYRSVFGLVGMIASLLLSVWIVQLLANRRRRRSVVES